MSAASSKDSEQLAIRVTADTHAKLQLALPFVKRRSMQDLVGTLIESFLEQLRTEDPGFAKALVGLRESQARHEGILTRRSAARGGGEG